MDIEIDDDDVIVVPSDREDEYLRQLAREYTIPCADCRYETCIGRCERLYAWRRKIQGHNKETAGGHSNTRRRKR